jgi:sulfite dehydrogenase (quinone) subunit SoeC
MNPAWSVILLTTLTGAGQGLFLALCGTEFAAAVEPGGMPPARFFVAGSALSFAFLGGGLVASFFHLGHPERAWRSAAMWRTSWLSREVIVLPAFLAVVLAYGAAHYAGCTATLWIAAIGMVLCLTLFVCTAMIYACLKFLQEWHTPLTLVNYFLLGCASGFTFATLLAAATAPDWVVALAETAAAFTLAGCVSRIASLVRNASLKPKSTLQSAIGIMHPRIQQKAQGQMGGSFNTREFFHGRSVQWLRAVKWIFLVGAFALPLILLAGGVALDSTLLLAAAFVVQFAGLLAERWFFFAQARHPQNLYYQVIS